MDKEIVIYNGKKVIVPSFVLEAMENFKPQIQHKKIGEHDENITKGNKFN